MITGSSSTSGCSCAETFYPSQWDALRALGSVQVRVVAGRARPFPTGACRCPTCLGWHLTTEPAAAAAPAAVSG